MWMINTRNIGNISIRKVKKIALTEVKSKANNLIKKQQYFNMHVILSHITRKSRQNTIHTKSKHSSYRISREAPVAIAMRKKPPYWRYSCFSSTDLKDFFKRTCWKRLLWKHRAPQQLISSAELFSAGLYKRYFTNNITKTHIRKSGKDNLSGNLVLKRETALRICELEPNEWCFLVVSDDFFLSFHFFLKCWFWHYFRKNAAFHLRQ